MPIKRFRRTFAASKYDFYGRVIEDYDDQNRLVSWPIFTATGGTPIQTNSLKYDDNNNIVSRSAFGDCAIEYKNDDHPHAVSAIAGVPDIMPRIDQDISYTNFSKVERIDEGNNHYSITYGADQERVKSVLQTPNGETVRYYLPNYEEVTNPLGTTDKIHYLCGGAVMVKSGGQWNLYYCYGDRLGSIVAVTDKEGNVAERYAYTPWGERRNPKDWTKPDSRTSFFNNRGFTGHEHLDAFNLIDMGGRVYDPMLGSFLSIDPYIQAPDNWLNYNRYLYCYGNPQIYTDPSGYESTPWWGDPGWTAPGYYEPSPSYSQYDSPGIVNWNTDAYKNNPSWWNNNSNTNYYGTNTGPGYIYVDPQTSHGQNTTSYNNGNSVYKRNQQLKSITVTPSISRLNTNIHNSSSPVRNTNIVQTVANTVSTINLAAGTIQYIGDKLISEATKYYTEGVSLYNKNNFRVKVPLLIGNVFPKVGTVKSIGGIAKWLGRATGVAGLGFTFIDGIKYGWQNHHTADIIVGGTFLVAGAVISSPYVLLAGGVYLITDIGSQFNTGSSLTEYLFD